MENVLKFLDGKKTIICAVLLGICNIGVAMKWWDWSQASVANGILGSFGLAFLRMGVDKSGKTIDSK